jgi:hypothetical protein
MNTNFQQYTKNAVSAVTSLRGQRRFWLAAALLAAVTGLSVPACAQARNDVRWSGDVDDTTIITIRGNDVRTDTVFGKQASNVNTQIFGDLPRGPIQTFLEYRHGRGQIRIVQEPTPDNGFTTKVRIHDPQPGRSHYDFALGWAPLDPPSGVYMAPPISPNGYYAPPRRFRG